MNKYEDRLITEAIREEMGINDELVSISDRLAFAIRRNLGEIPRARLDIGVLKNIVTFKKKIFDEVLTFKIHNYFFGNTDAYKAYRDIHPKPKNNFDDSIKEINIHVDYVNDNCHPEELNGAIYHELKHHFQNFKSGVSYKPTDQYKIASMNINNKKEVYKMVSRCVFYSHKREIYAYTGQAYESIMNMPKLEELYGDVRNAVKSTKLYKNYTMLKEAFKFVSEGINKENMLQVLPRLGVTYSHLIERVNLALKEYAKYIGRVIVKCEKDILQKQLNEGVTVDFSDGTEEFFDMIEKL